MKISRLYDSRKFIIIILISIIFGFVLSFIWPAVQYFRAGEHKGKFRIEDAGISYDDGITAAEGVYQVSEKGGKIFITFEKETYISKLQYEYNTDLSSEKNGRIKIYGKNLYGDQAVKTVKDNYFKNLSRSVVNINNEVSKIVIKLPKGNKQLTVKNFIIDNRFKYNPYLFAVTAVALFCVLFLILFRKENVLHPGWTVFICAMTIGICILLLQPPFCTGWDEQIHFSASYHMALRNEPQGVPNVLYYLIDNAPWINEHNHITLEERLDLIKNMNTLGTAYGQQIAGYNVKMSSAGYVLQAAAISAGRLLHFPFYIVWLMGKFANLLLYSIGMAFAVSIIPVGKKLLSVIALMPTMIFTSTVYTYDITVNVFIIISICVFVRELCNKEQWFETKWRVVYFAGIIIGCMPKAVYAPLVLNAFFLPKSKFRSSKDERIFRILSVVVFLVLMSTFVLPSLLAPSAGGDARGGDTSVATQMSYVLGKPIAYAVVLIKNMGETFIPYIFKNAVYSFGYCGTATFAFLYTGLLAVVTLTDTYGEKKEDIIKIRYKVIALLTMLATMSLIWTALYLSFTEVGETEIAGVQPRYYLPFLFLFYLCFRTKKIKNEIKEENYQMAVMLFTVILLFANVFDIFIIASCL